jgi:CHAD domain-containing protein
MASDAEWRRLKRELKWINRRLGAARDLDVLVQRQAEKDAPRLTVDEQIALDRRWLASHARLARALQSSRYRRLLQRTSDWIERGPWASAGGARQDRLRQEPLGAWCSDVLSRWHDRLVKRSRRLDEMDEEMLHRLRLRTKRLRYAMEDYGPYVPDRPPNWSQAMAKQLRRAQGALGEINDAAQAPIRNGLRLNAKARKRLLREAEAAYRELGQLA